MKMKKWLALLLAVVTVLSLTACSKNEGEKTNTSKEEKSEVSATDLYNEAMALIEDGDYETAYLLLKDVEITTDSNEEDKLLYDLKSKLVFVPIEITFPYDGTEGHATFTYDENGYILSAVYDRWKYSDSFSHDTGWDSLQCSWSENALVATRSYPNGYWQTTTYAYDDNGNLLTSESVDSEGGWDKTIKTYNEKGDNIKHEYTDEYGSYIFNHTYDDDGNLRYLEHITTNADGSSWQKYAYHLDANGNYLSEEKTNSKGRWSKEVGTYDDNGNRIKSERTSYSGEWTKVTSSFDDNGNYLTTKIINSDDTWEKRTYTYDENGNQLSAEYSYSDGRWDTYTFTYDKHNNLLTKKHIGSDNEQEQHAYTYNKDGNILTYRYSNNSDEWEEVTYAYTQSGNLHTKQVTDSDWLNVKYSYDVYGNITAAVKHGQSYSATWELYYYPEGAPDVVTNCCDVANNIFDLD